jgi:hypothetical protein
LPSKALPLLSSTPATRPRKLLKWPIKVYHQGGGAPRPLGPLKGQGNRRCHGVGASFTRDFTRDARDGPYATGHGSSTTSRRSSWIFWRDDVTSRVGTCPTARHWYDLCVFVIRCW